MSRRQPPDSSSNPSPAKRPRLDDSNATVSIASLLSQPAPRGLSLSATPPRASKHAPSTPAPSSVAGPSTVKREDTNIKLAKQGRGADVKRPTNLGSEPKDKYISSPFTLTTIADLPWEANGGTADLGDLIGSPLVEEAWVFNYLHDIDWTMSKLDVDVRPYVKVTFIHGNWKQEDPARIKMADDAAKWEHVKVVAAHMPEMFGTHHSKILVLFFRDDHARVIIHTANMIPFDWANMTQAAWISPRLPLISTAPTSDAPAPSPIGDAFKLSFLAYLKAYGPSRTGRLSERISQYSFFDVRAIFVGSVPGKHELSTASFGWPRLRAALSEIRVSPTAHSKVFAQVSSIATLGANDSWLTPVLLRALRAGKNVQLLDRPPRFGLIFPTVKEVRDSLNGYASGHSIHLRKNSPAQEKQMKYLRPLFYRWGGSSSDISKTSSTTIDLTKDKHNGIPKPPARDAQRASAAPHIKTYIRFSKAPDRTEETIDWALLTSANLSTQAWGAAMKDGTVRVCSYEAGVLVHPGLWGAKAKMVPTFGVNEPLRGKRPPGGVGVIKTVDDDQVVALRMPYSLPLEKYAPSDEPWWNGGSYSEKDRLGNRYDS